MVSAACNLKPADRDHMWNVIITDLADFGIRVRVPTSVDAKKSHVGRGARGCGGPVFGVSLADQPAEDIPSIGRVPLFLVRARQALVESRQVEGIFRKNGSVGRQKMLRELLDAGNPLPDDVMVHDLTSLVKQFFRELPEPLIPIDLTPAFLQASSQQNDYERSRLLLLLCLMMPSHHLETLAFIVVMLKQIACEAEHNKMDAHNLAVCMAPNFFHKPPDEQLCAKRAHTEASIVETLIGQADYVGSLPELLLEQLLVIDSLPDNPEGEMGPCNGKGGHPVTPADADSWITATDDVCNCTEAVSAADESSASQTVKKKRSGSLGKLKKALRRSWESLIGKDKSHGDASTRPNVVLHAPKRKVDTAGSAAGDEPTGQPPAPKKRKALLDLHSAHQSYSPTTTEAQEKSAIRMKVNSPFNIFKKRSLSRPASSEKRRCGSPLTSAGRRVAEASSSSPAMACVPQVGRRLAHIESSSCSRSGAELASRFPLRVDPAGQSGVGLGSPALSAAVTVMCPPVGGSAGCTSTGLDQQRSPAYCPLPPQDGSAQRHQFTIRDGDPGCRSGSDARRQHSPPTLQHLRRAAAVPNGDVLPSRLHPLTPLGALGSWGGKIDKAKISRPLLALPATAAAAALDKETEAAASVFQLGGSCQLLSLDEAMAAGAGKPCFSPPESHSLFERVRSFRRQQHPLGLPNRTGSASICDQRGPMALAAATGVATDGRAGERSASPTEHQGDNFGSAVAVHNSGSRMKGQCQNSSRIEGPDSSTNVPEARPDNGSITLDSKPDDGILTVDQHQSVATSKDIAVTPSSRTASLTDYPEVCRPVDATALASQPPACPVGGTSCSASDESSNGRGPQHDSCQCRSPAENGLVSEASVSISQNTTAAAATTAACDHVTAVGSSPLPADSATGKRFPAIDVPGDNRCLSSTPLAAAQAGRLGPVSFSTDINLVLPRPAPAGMMKRPTSGGTTSSVRPPPALRVMGSLADNDKPSLNVSILKLKEAALVRRSPLRQADVADESNSSAASPRRQAIARDSTSSSAAGRTSGSRAAAPYRYGVESMVHRRPQVPPASVFSSGDRRYCSGLVKAVIEGQHDDIVSRRVGDSGSISMPAKPAAAVTTAGTANVQPRHEAGADRPATFVEATPPPVSLPRPALRESNTPYAPATLTDPAKPPLAAQLPCIKQPVLPLCGFSSTSRTMLQLNQRQLKRLTNSPGASASSRTPRRAYATSVPRGTTAVQPTRGSPPRPLPCGLSTLAADDEDEHDTLV